MPTVIRTVFLLLFFAVAAQAQTVTQQDYITARQRLRVGLDTSRYFTSIALSITGAATHRQAPTAKAVWDLVAANTFSLVTGPTLSGAGTAGSPLNIAQQGAANGQPLEWNASLGRWAPGTDDGTTYTGGTGISVVGTVINNTAPDQTVSITGATGTYPNFSLPDASSTNEIQSLSLTGQALGISGGGTGVTLPIVGVNAGTGIGVGVVGGVATVTNTGDTNAADDHTGTGTTNYIAKWTGSTALASSQMFDNGALVGIGATSGAGRLRVVGNGNTSATYTAQFHNSAGNNNALLIRDDRRVSMGTTSANAYLNVRYNGGYLKEKVLEFENPDGWGAKYIATYANDTYFRRGILFGGTDIGGVERDGLSINFYPSPRVGVNMRDTSDYRYSFEVASASDTDGIVVSRPDDKNDLAMFHTNSEGDGILRSKSGFWTLGDIDDAIANSNPAATLHLFAPDGNAFPGVYPILRATRRFGFGDFLVEQGYTTGPGTKETYLSDGTNRIITMRTSNNSAVTWVGINQTNPQQQLHISGNMRLTGSAGTPTAVMGRDANGDISNLTLSGLSVVSGVLTNTGDTNAADDITTTTNAGGDLTGTFGNLSIIPNGVTATKLATDAVTTVKIAADAVTQAKMADNSVGPAELVNTTVTAGTYNFATIVVDSDGRITSAGTGTPQNIYNTDGSFTGSRGAVLGSYTLTFDASTSTFPTALPLVVKGKADASNNTQVLTAIDAGNTTRGFINMTDTKLSLTAANGHNAAVEAGSQSWLFAPAGWVRLPGVSVNPTLTTGNAGAIWWNTTDARMRYNVSSSARTFANVEDDFTGSTNTYTSSFTITGTQYFPVVDATAANRVVTVDNNMREGFDYVLRATGNGTNTVTVTPAVGYTLAVDGTTGSPANYVLTSHEVIRLTRSGTTITIDK